MQSLPETTMPARKPEVPGRIAVRLTEEARAFLQAEAKRTGLSYSRIVNQSIIGHAEAVVAAARQEQEEGQAELDRLRQRRAKDSAK